MVHQEQNKHLTIPADGKIIFKKKTVLHNFTYYISPSFMFLTELNLKLNFHFTTAYTLFTLFRKIIGSYH